MKSHPLLKFLQELFRVNSVWIDKGQGRWVMRRRLHPLLRLMIASVMIFLITWGISLFFRQEEPDVPESPVTVKPFLPGSSTPPDAFVPIASDSEGRDSEPIKETEAVKAPEQKPEKTVKKQNIENLKGKPKQNKEDTSKPPVRAEQNWIKISKSDYRLYLYKGNKLLNSYSVAIGKNPGNKRSVGDNRTPVGTFKVQSIENAERWTHDFGDGMGEIQGAYGPWFIRLATGWKGIGIHGTHAPESLGTNASEGCIRMNNEEVKELRDYVSKGTVVIIEE